MVRYRPVDYDPFAPASRGVSLKPVDYDPFAPKKKPTDFIDDMQRGAGQAIAAVGSALRDVPIKDISILGQKAEEYGNKVVQANPADMPSVQEIKSVGDALNFASERVAEIIPQAAAPLAAAGLATLAGAAAPIAGAASFGVGALSGFGQAYGGIREEQRKQGIEDKVRAATFATPSAALDAFGVGRFIPGSKRILGDIIETGLRGIAKTGARVGAEEGVTEVAQTALERAGALKSLTDEEALAEYLNSLAAGAVGGGTIGAGGATARTVIGGRPAEVEPPISGTFETEIGGQPARANVTQDGDIVTIDYGNGNVATVNRDAWDTYVSGGTFAPVTEPEVEPESGVPATSFGAPPVSETPPAGPAGPTVTIDAEEVIIEQPDGSFQVIPRAEWEATQGPAPALVAVAEPVTEPAPAPVSRIFQPSGQPAPEPEPAPPPPSDDSRIFKPSAPEPAPEPTPKIFGEDVTEGQPAPEPKPAPPPPSDTSRIFNPRAPEPVRISMPPYVRPPEFKVGRPAREPEPAPSPAPTAAPVPTPAPAKPPRAQKLPTPKAATTMQAYIAQIAKTFKKGQDRYSFEKAVDAGVDPDWLNSRADLRRMFGKEKLTRGRDGKVVQNRRQIDENLKDFADLAMGFQPKDWGLYGDSLDENGYVTREALADLINRDAPRYDPTTGRPYEQEVQEEDYGFEATVEAVSREASDLGVDLTDADMRAIAERIGADGDPAQGIVDYVNEQFEEVMAEARDYSEYDAGQEEFPDGPITNIEDSTAEPGVGGQAAAPGDTGQGQADREQPAGTAPQGEEGSLGLSAEQAAPQGGMTERQRAEMQARLQQSQMRRGNQEAVDQQEGGMFDASRDQDGLFKNIPNTSRRPDLVEEPRNTDIDALIGSLPPGQRVNVRAQLDRIMDRYEKNKDVGMLLAGLDSLRRDVDARIYRNQLKRARPLVRGFERAMEVLYRAERDGLLTPESAALARWLIQRNPRIADNLAFSFQAGNENSPAGDYTSITRVARIFAGGADGLTAAHEILHHTERMMPEQIREGIRAAWRNRIDSLMEIANRTNNVEMRLVLGAIVQAYYGNEQAQRELAEAFREGSIPYSVYHLSNPSEFWAVNASELLSDRASRAGWVGAARNWLRDFIESAKDFFGLPNNAAVLRGLRAVLAAESGAMTGEMLANQAVLNNINAQPSTPQQPPSGPQQPPSGPQQSLFPPSQLPPSLTLPKETRGQRYSRKLVDRFERLRVVQSLGQLAAGIEGFYEAARKFDSRAGELMKKFERDFGNKIKEIARNAGFGMNDIDLYLYSKAAPEINADFEMREIGRLVRKKGGDPAIMTKVNGTNQNFDMNQRERDWTPDQPRWSHPDPGIDAAILAEYKKANTTLLSGSGISNKDAFDEVDPLENGPKGQAWKDIANVHRDSVKWALDNDVARGVKSRKVADEMLKAIPHYVPVKGKTKPGQYLSDADFALMDDQGDSYEEMMSGGAGFSITKNEWRQRRGRKTLPFSPYGTFVSDIGARIVRGERNRVGQKMMDFFIKNPSNEWRVFSDRNPPRDRNGNIRRPDPRDPNFMVVKRGGETFYLRIEDPLLKKAAKNLNPTQMNAFLQISSNLTRILARSLTTVNPDFFLPNFFRDIESAALNLGAESPGLLKAFSKFVRDKKAIRSVAAFEYGNKGGDPALRDLYEQFKLDGGSVSWVERETPQEAAARIQKDLKTVNDSLKDLKDARSAKEAIDAVWNPTSKGFRAMVGALESTNATFENTIRFAAYRAALDVGMSRDQAAMIARESTVDFNRRGEAGAMLNALYVFFNAGIQGTVRTARALSNNPFKTGKLSITQAALLSAMATAATLAAANAGISGEDDDGKLHWDKIPDYEKQRNLIIMNPLDGKTYAKIPMPYGFGFFPYLATRTMDAARTGEDLGAVGLEIMSAGLSNFSPIQFSAGSIQSSVAKAVTPTLGRPFVELMLNENFMGKPIYNEPFDKGQSYASVARFNTPEGYKELSRVLNDISGGEGKVKGEFNFPAESFEYLTDFALGGVGNLAKALYKTGEEGDVMAAPVVKRLVGQPGKGRNVGEYYEREEKARSVNQQLKDSTIAERAALKKKFPVETSPRVQSALTSARSEVVRLNKEYKRIQNLDINEGVKAQRLERLREQIDGAFVRFNRVYNQVEQATR